MKVLFIGDIVGRPGREAVKHILPDLRKELGLDFVIGNAENLAHGKGITEMTYKQIMETGVDFLTSGNHIFAKSEALPILERKDSSLIRPANYPEGTPGRGYEIIEVRTKKIAIINLMGRVFFREDLDCPFRKLDQIIDEIGNRIQESGDRDEPNGNLKPETSNPIPTIVDFHSEASSEARAFGFYADGRVSAVLGTHRHIQSADEQILPGGTAYQTDVGMVGARDSVLGVEKDIILKKFLTQLPAYHEMAEGEVEFNATFLEIDDKGEVKKAKRVKKEA